MANEIGGDMQSNENAHLKVGKKPVKRLKARHLSRVAQEEIVRLFAARQSYDDVAMEMDIQGLTGRTVSEVLHVFTMRKPPASEQRPFIVQRRLTA